MAAEKKKTDNFLSDADIEGTNKALTVVPGIGRPEICVYFSFISF